MLESQKIKKWDLSRKKHVIDFEMGRGYVPSFTFFLEHFKELPVNTLFEFYIGLFGEMKERIGPYGRLVIDSVNE